MSTQTTDTTTTTAAPSPIRRLLSGSVGRNLGLVLALAVIFIVGTITDGSSFASLDNILVILRQASVIGVISIGMTFVILSGGIDLSVGSVMAFSTMACAWLTVEAGLPANVVVPAVLIFGLLSGAFTGAIIHYFNVQPFIATLSMMFLARGLASVLSTTPERLADESAIRTLATKWKIIDGPKVNDLVVEPGVIIALLVVVAVFVMLHRTRFGRTIYALGGSEQSAQLMGLPVHRTKMAVYMISGTLSGVAAVVYTSRLGMAQNITGVGWELDAIAAAVIGGTLLTGGAGYVLGSVIGALVLGLMNVLITRDGTIPPEATTIITGCILLAFVVLQRVVSVKKASSG